MFISPLTPFDTPDTIKSQADIRYESAAYEKQKSK